VIFGAVFPVFEIFRLHLVRRFDILFPQSSERFSTMPRELAILACTECKRRNYTTTRNKRTQTNRVEMKKYCPTERKRTLHKEVK
jgi:large subunit ribosomal protein L33